MRDFSDSPNLPPSGRSILEGAAISGDDGLRGRVVEASGEDAVVELDDGRRLRLPIRLLAPEGLGGYRLQAAGAELDQYRAEQSEGELVVPVLREELAVHRRRVETGGGVRIRKVVHERRHTIDEPIYREELAVERVPVNRVVDGPVAIRHEGTTMIVPIVEEVLVVEKRLVLKEEVRITRRHRELREPQEVTLRSEEVVVEQQDAATGEWTAVPAPAVPDGAVERAVVAERDDFRLKQEANARGRAGLKGGLSD